MREKGTRVKMHIDPFERRWMMVSVGLLVIFAATVTVAGFALGFQVPSPEARVDPNTVSIGDQPFADPGLREISQGEYEAYVLAQSFVFSPREITVPVGSKVTFYVTSIDVQHGFKLQETNLNMQIVPGQVSTLTVEFDTEGQFDFICNEYCGTGHATMFGSVIVGPIGEEG